MGAKPHAASHLVSISAATANSGYESPTLPSFLFFIFHETTNLPLADSRVQSHSFLSSITTYVLTRKKMRFVAENTPQTGTTSVLNRPLRTETKLLQKHTQKKTVAITDISFLSSMNGYIAIFLIKNKYVYTRYCCKTFAAIKMGATFRMLPTL